MGGKGGGNDRIIIWITGHCGHAGKITHQMGKITEALSEVGHTFVGVAIPSPVWSGFVKQDALGFCDNFLREVHDKSSFCSAAKELAGHARLGEKGADEDC